LKIFFHDFGAYPFFFPLTEQLAQRGYAVTHANVNTLSIERNFATEAMTPNHQRLPLRMPGDYHRIKYSFPRRFRMEQAYGRQLRSVIEAKQPDLIISANAPTHIQAALQRAARKLDIPFICWVQDFYSEAVRSILQQKFGFAGSVIGSLFKQWERRQLLCSDGVMVITDAFREPLLQWGVPEKKIETLENWAPIESLPVLAQENSWSLEQGLDGKFCFLYSGTMGLKHNPDLLLSLAEKYRHDPNVKVVVVAEGSGADFLQVKADASALDETLIILPMQPAERVPEVLATASVLVATLEAEASHICVPSKVLTYLCAHRPLLLSIASENLAAQTVNRESAGFTTEPHDSEGFLARADELRQDPERCESMGCKARVYAEKAFQIEKIVDRFERFLGRVL
jgi:glycosyltransferase involved in cell wall biosynthesis